LGYHQQGAVDRSKRKVHFAGIVSKYPDAQDAVQQEIRVVFAICFSHADQDHETALDRADAPPVDPNFGAADTLKNCTHRLVLWSTRQFGKRPKEKLNNYFIRKAWRIGMVSLVEAAPSCPVAGKGRNRSVCDESWSLPP
jgi:hypothetical protein